MKILSTSGAGYGIEGYRFESCLVYFKKHGKTLVKSQPQGVPEWCSKVAKVVDLPPYFHPNGDR